jgi:hypothetical protein
VSELLARTVISGWVVYGLQMIIIVMAVAASWAHANAYADRLEKADKRDASARKRLHKSQATVDGLESKHRSTLDDKVSLVTDHLAAATVGRGYSDQLLQAHAASFGQPLVLSPTPAHPAGGPVDGLGQRQPGRAPADARADARQSEQQRQPPAALNRGR